MVNALETILQQVVDITILLFEFMGVLVIIAAGLRGIYDSEIGRASCRERV